MIPNVQRVDPNVSLESGQRGLVQEKNVLVDSSVLAELMATVNGLKSTVDEMKHGKRYAPSMEETLNSTQHTLQHMMVTHCATFGPAL